MFCSLRIVGIFRKSGGALTKEILCNVGQWFAIYPGYNEYHGIFHEKNEKDEWVPNNNLTRGQKAFGYVVGAATVLNAVDAAKRSYDIAHDVIKGSNNKSYTTDKKESKNYWPILEAFSGASHCVHAFWHSLTCENHFCYFVRCATVVGLASLADAYFRFRGSNQNSGSQNSGKNPNTNNADNIKAQKSKNKQ